MKNQNKNDIVMINLDRPRELRLSHKTLKIFLAESGIGMEDFDEAVAGYEGMCRLAYAMLRREDPDLTEAQCDDLLDMAPLGEVIDKIREAIEAAFGNGEKEAEPVTLDGDTEVEEDPTESETL